MESDRSAGLFLFLASIGALAVAFASQYWGGLQPCVLCVYQRWPYGATIALGFLALVAGGPGVRRTALTLCILVLLVEAGIAGFHVGVEYGWWEGTATCSSVVATPGSIDALRAALAHQPVVACDRPQWTFLGLSLAGINFLYAAFLLWRAAAGLRQRPRRFATFGGSGGRRLVKRGS